MVGEINPKDVLSMPVARLQLSVRAANCLKNVNIVFVGDLVRMTPAELLRIPNMGRASLNIIENELRRLGLNLGMDPDAMSEVEGESRAGEIDSFVKFGQRNVHGAGSGPMVGETDPKDVLSMPVTRLELTVRAANCIKNMNVATIGDLVRIAPAELLRTPNMGRKSLKIIEDELLRLGLSLGMDIDDILDTERKGRAEEIDSFVGAINRARARGIESIADLLELRPDDLAASFDMGHEDLGAMNRGLRRWDLRLGMHAPKLPENVFCHDDVDTFKDELLCIVRQLLSDLETKYAYCLIARGGIGDRPQATLEQIAERAAEHGFDGPVSRERVRQVEGKAEIRLRSRAESARFSLWESSTQAARRNLPAAVGPFLLSFGYEVTNEPERVFRSLKRFASDIFRLNFPFELARAGDRYVVLDSEDEIMRDVLECIERFQPDMYVETAEIARRAGCDEHVLGRAIRAHPIWQFLDESGEYLWRRPPLPPSNYRLVGNLMLTCLFRVFSLVREARTADLVQSIPRHRLVDREIPAAVIEGIAERSGSFDVRNGEISRKEGIRWNTARPRDMHLLRICLAEGQVVSSEILYSSLVRMGMSSNDAGVTVAHSPLLVHTQAGFGSVSGVYKFICRPDTIDVEALREEEGREEGDDDREAGEDSILRLEIPVGGRVRLTGRHTLAEGWDGPRGEWDVRDMERGVIGRISISDRTIGGIEPIIEVLGARTGDTLEFTRRRGDGEFVVVRRPA